MRWRPRSGGAAAHGPGWRRISAEGDGVGLARWVRFCGGGGGGAGGRREGTAGAGEGEEVPGRLLLRRVGSRSSAPGAHDVGAAAGRVLGQVRRPRGSKQGQPTHPSTSASSWSLWCSVCSGKIPKAARSIRKCIWCHCTQRACRKQVNFD